MSQKISITCDTCQKELIVDSKYPAHYSLELKAINTGTNSSGSQYAVYVRPPFDGVRHFCGFNCLKNWDKMKSVQ